MKPRKPSISVADIPAYKWRYRLNHRPQDCLYRPLSAVRCVARKHREWEVGRRGSTSFCHEKKLCLCRIATSSCPVFHPPYDTRM